jgi:hypothetical protein
MSVTLEGPLFTGQVRPAIRRAAERAKGSIVSEAKSLSRVDTGLMRSSWNASLSASGNGIMITLDNPVPYTVYQEFGTSRIKPMLAGTQAMAKAKSVFSSALSTELSSALGAAIDVAESTALRAIRGLFGG